jgi:hypothetical protein
MPSSPLPCYPYSEVYEHSTMNMILPSKRGARFFTFSSHDIRTKEPVDQPVDPDSLKTDVNEQLTSSTEYCKVVFNSSELQKRYEEEMEREKNSFFRKAYNHSNEINERCNHESFVALKVEPNLPIVYTPPPVKFNEYFTFSYGDICKSLQKTQKPLKVGHWTTFPRSSVDLISQTQLIQKFEILQQQREKDARESELLQRVLTKAPNYVKSEFEQTRHLDRAFTAPLLARRNSSEFSQPILQHSNSVGRVNSRASRLQAALERKEMDKIPSIAFVDERTEAIILQSNKIARKPMKSDNSNNCHSSCISVPPHPPARRPITFHAPSHPPMLSSQPVNHRPVSHEYSRFEASLQVAERIPSFKASLPNLTHYLSYDVPPPIPMNLSGKPSFDHWLAYHQQQYSLWKLMQSKWNKSISNQMTNPTLTSE